MLGEGRRVCAKRTRDFSLLFQTFSPLFSSLFSSLFFLSFLVYVFIFILSCLFSLLSSPFSFRSSLRSFQRRGGFRVANWDPPRRCTHHAAPSRRVKPERLSSSRAPALYSDSQSHYYWVAKIKEIATSRKRATLQHFSSILGPKPSETQGR